MSPVTTSAPQRNGSAATPPPPTPAVDGPLPAAVLSDIVSGIAAAPLWKSLVRHDHHRREPVRVLATERYEVWVIGWTTGQNVHVHDHGPSAGAFVVVEGELTEVVPQIDGPPVERTLPPGQVRVLPTGLIHDVVNLSEAPASSIHVYSPPLTTMAYYDPDTLEPLATEDVAPESPALPPRAGSFLLHPATRGTRGDT